MLRRAIPTTFAAILLSAAANAQVTQAWHQVVTTSGGPMWDSRFGPHCLDCDKAGNVYFAYAGAMFSQTVQGLHLVKITPTGKQRFDTVLTSMPPYSTNPDLGTMPFNVQGAYVSAPANDGSQSVYVLMTSAPLNGGIPSDSIVIWLMKYSTSGQPMWQTAFSYELPPYRYISPVGFYAGGDGFVRLAYGTEAQMGAPAWPNTLEVEPHEPLVMLTLDDFRGFLLRELENPNIQPVTIGGVAEDLMRPGGFWTAVFEPIRQRWIVTGRDISSTFPANDALDMTMNRRWGVYNPDTGAEDYAEVVPGYYPLLSGGEITWPEVMLNLLPNGNVAVSSNILYCHQNNGMQWDSFAHSTSIIGPTNNLVWKYPTSGFAPGGVYDVAAFDGNSLIYLAGLNLYGYQRPNPQFLESFKWNGNLTSHLDNHEVGALYPFAGGVYTAGFYPNPASRNTNLNYSFLSHFDGPSSSFDLLTKYTPSSDWAICDAASSGGSFYILSSQAWSTTAWCLERYVTGLNLQSVSSPTTAPQNTPLPVTITLNQPAGHYGYPVGLFSNSSALLMPNGTRSQNFRVPAGQSSITVNLSAGAVSANTTVTLLATQNGVNRTTATTITP